MNLSLILLLIINSIPSVWAANGRTDVWPGFRGLGDSHTAARELPLEWADDKNVAWDVALPGYGQSSPVVWRDRVFLTAVEGANKEKLLVFSQDLKGGRQLWVKEFPATFTMKDANTVSKAAPTPAVDERRVYVFFESGDLFAFDHKGNPQWRRKLAEEYGAYKTNHGLGSSIALTDKAVIALVAHGGPSYLLAVDKQTGKNLWKSDMKAG
ncbi:MAG TPA: PQQ-binding-like beta-propeller repeat protein, partial [Blastocatellia bacterium]|nr:PQQ-binding-like beta-propeller repeat protein [Blastocatellia bacterium]